MRLRLVSFSLILLAIFIFSFNSVSAQPPVTQVQQFEEGYTIVESQHEYLKLNQNYQYNFFVYNTSTGLLLDNTTMTCNFFLANASGEVILSSEVTYFSDKHWGLDILGSNFSQTGSYPYGVNCQDGNGGALAGIFEVIPSGFNITVGLYIILLVLSMGIVILGFYIQDNWVIVLGGFAMVVVGLLTLFYGIAEFKDEVYTWSIGLITLMLGAYFSVRGSMESLS